MNRTELNFGNATIGHRLAYDAAMAQGVDGAVIRLYEASIMALDPAWYAEHEDISRQKQHRMFRVCRSSIPLSG